MKNILFYVFVMDLIVILLCVGLVTTLPFDSREECGTEASSNPLHQNPWLAYLEYYVGDAPSAVRCAGTLISPDYVLTAAHCMKTAKFTSLKVRLGEYDLSSNTECVEWEGSKVCAPAATSIQVAEIIIHKDFMGLEHDVALLRLSEPAPYSDFIRPICLPRSRRMHLKPQTTLHSTGWGELVDENDLGRYAHIKKRIDLPLWNTRSCKNVYHKEKLPNGIICAGGVAGMDTCRGDSGGPLVADFGAKMEIVGVTSAGYLRCGTAGYPGVYTRVTGHLDWIRSVIRR